jgi:RsiW-degrading membrane proteinase PrsW (M82 family)
MTFFGPVDEAAHGGHSSASFDLVVGFFVLAFTWVGFFKKHERKKVNMWIAIAITAICGVFIFSGVKELIR